MNYVTAATGAPALTASIIITFTFTKPPEAQRGISEKAVFTLLPHANAKAS